jgi:hypothetical protein
MMQTRVVVIQEPMGPVRQYVRGAEPSREALYPAAGQITTQQNVIVDAKRIQSIKVSKDFRVEEAAPVQCTPITLEHMHLLEKTRLSDVLVEMPDLYTGAALANTPASEPNRMRGEQA